MSQLPRPASDFSCRFSLDTSVGAFLNEARVRLLESVGRHGSITQAAKALPMSYKSAWDAIDAMNRIAGTDLVVRSTGGRHGGGAQLTPYGLRVITLYRALQLEYQDAFARVITRFDDAQTPSIADCRAELHRQSMLTSARNRFSGAVGALRDSPGGVEVLVQGNRVAPVRALITRDSAEALDLRIGTPVLALAKAAAVRLSVHAPASGTTENVFSGQVTAVEAGGLHARVVLAADDGGDIAAVVAMSDLANLSLEAGSRCYALIPAASVILVRFT